MMNVEGEFAKIRRISPSATVHYEGGNPLVALKGFGFRAAGQDVSMDLLLHPSAHSGYLTRLFFERPVHERGQNWTQHSVLGRNWWAPSWQGVSAELPWPSMLCEHLRVVQ